MTETVIGVIVIILLGIIAILIGVGDLALFFMAGLSITMPKKKRRKEEEDESIDGVIFNPPGAEDGGKGSLMVPTHKLPEFLKNMAKASSDAKIANSPEAKAEEEKKQADAKRGYI